MQTTPLFRFDTNSPYAYLAAMRVDDVLGHGVEWQPIAFGFVLAAQGRRPWSFDEPTRSQGVAECERRAAERGLPPMAWPPDWPIGSYTLEPLRALTAAKAHGRERELARELYRRNFVTGEGLKDTAVVRSCWSDAGLDPARYDDELEAAKQPLREVTEAAIAEGVHGVPTITVGGEHFWGDDRLADAAAALGAAPLR
jgi:2-hydroxychromene-2-carboxylate isomerase